MKLTSDARANISTLGAYPTRENALDFILPALKRRASWVLEHLRDLDDGPDAIQEWAKHHHLLFPIVVEFMTNQRAHWVRYPYHGKALRFTGIAYITAGLAAPGDDAWVREHMHARNLPDPSHESLRDWIARATRLYKSREALSNGRKRHPAPRWGEFARRCDWFVQRQVLRWNPSKIRQFGESADRRAIDRGSDSIIRLLGGTPSRRQKGTPKRKVRIK